MPRVIFNKLLICCSLAFCSLFLSGITQASVEWINAQAQADGSISTAGDIATPFQATSEVLETYSQMGMSTLPVVSPARSFINAEIFHSTENLSRKIKTNISFGQDVTLLVSELVKNQNEDGGFGEFAGYASTVLDTAYALQALYKANYTDQQIISGAITYLSRQQGTNGGFSLSSANTSSIYLTSQSSLALQPYIFTYPIGGVINQASGYLFTQQLPSGGWSTVWETAQALLALIPVTSDSSRYRDALSILQNAQLMNGSWSNEVYSTALAARVLYIATKVTLPIDPTAGLIRGKVVNPSGLALSGVTISVINSANTYNATTGSGGLFSLQNITVGDYTITYSASGYLSATQQVSVLEGSLIDVGTIRLAPQATEGVIQGTVTDSDTGLPLAGVTVSITTGSVQNVITNNGGKFSAAVTPGSVSINVSVAGYFSTLGSTTIVAGQTMIFSPALVPVTSTNPQTTVGLRGTILDAVSKTPINSATVTVSGSGSAQTTTNANGEFTFSGLTAGDTIVTITAGGFQSTAVSLLTSPGGNVDIGTLQLEQLVIPATATVIGTVIDRDTGLPVIGATIEIEGTSLRATSDVNGNYTINGITSLQFTMLASASGYLTSFQPVTLAEVGVVTVELSLQQASVGGVVIDGLWTDQITYNAYSDAGITAIVRNGNSSAASVKILLQVLDASDQLVQGLMVNQQGNQSAGIDEYNILPGTSLDIVSDWTTRNLPAGMYKVNLKVFDQFTGQLLTERTSLLTIQSSQVIEQASLLVTPSFANVGANTQWILTLHTVNRSNTDVMMDLTYELAAPSGTIVATGSRTVTLSPGSNITNTELANEPLTFAESGDYQATFAVTAGTIPIQQTGAVLPVAPSVRVEAEQSVNPTQVVPDGDKRIRVRIQLRGVDSQ